MLRAVDKACIHIILPFRHFTLNACCCNLRISTTWWRQITQVGVELGIDACQELLDAERPEAERRLLKQAVYGVLSEASSWQDATGSSAPSLKFTAHRRVEPKATATTNGPSASTTPARHRTAPRAANSPMAASSVRAELETESVAPRLPGARMLRLRTRKMGPHLLVDVELEVPPRVSASGAHQVRKSHDLSC